MRRIAALTFFAVFIFFQHTSVHAFKLHEVGIGSGYSFGNLKTKNTHDFESIPIFMQFGWELNSNLGWEEHRGVLTFIAEPFVSPIIQPHPGVQSGLLMGLKYRYPLTDWLSPYIDASSGPMYFGIDTIEQGHDGLEFLSHLGSGIQVFFDDNKSINLGYHYQHISHGEMRAQPNGGFESHNVILGFSWFYQ